MAPHPSTPDNGDVGHAAGAPTDGRRERWRSHREARRRELVRAVVDAVRRHGAAVGMDDIARETGLAKQVFYRYFADKADLHLAVGRTVAGWVVRELTRVLDEQPEPRAMLAAGVETYLRLVEAEPEVYRYVVTAPHTAAGAPADDYSEVLGMHVSRLIGDRMREAGLDSGAAEPWGFALVGSVRSAVDHWLARPTMSRDAVAAYLTDFVWAGLEQVLRPPAAVRPLRDPLHDTAAGH